MSGEQPAAADSQPPANTGVDDQPSAPAPVVDDSAQQIALPEIIQSDAIQIGSTNPTTGQLAALKFTLTPTVAIPEDGIVEVELPKWITTSQGADSDLPMVTEDTLTECVVHQDTKPECTIEESTNSDGSPGNKVMIIKGFEGHATRQGGEVLNIGVINIRNPISLKPMPGFRVSTLDGNKNYLNQSEDLTLTMTKIFTHSAPGDSSVKLFGDTAKDRQGSYKCTFKTTIPIPQGGYLTLTLPDEVQYESIDAISIVEPSHFSADVKIEQGQSAKELIFKNSFSDKYVAEGSPISFTLTYLKNPTDPQPSGSFAFATFDESGFAIEKLDSGMTVSSKTGKLKNIAFSPDKGQQGVYQISSQYDLKMVIENDFTSDMALFIEFTSGENQFKPMSNTTCAVTTATFPIGLNIECRVSAKALTIAINNLVDQTIPAGSTMELQLGQVRVRNPGSVKFSSTVYVYTADAEKVIDIGTSAAFSPTPSRLLLANVMPDSTQTSKQNVEYILTLQPDGRVPQDAVIKVILPDEIEINDFSAINDGCGDLPITGAPLQNGQLPELKCTVIDSGRAIKINKLFEYGSTSFFQAISFTIPGLQNPRLVNVPSSSFKVYVFEDDSMAYEVFEMIEGVTTTMTELHPFDKTSVRAGSLVNKAIATYNVNAEGILNAKDGDRLEVGFPEQIRVKEPFQCEGSGSTMKPALSCVYNSLRNVVQVTISLREARRRQLYTGKQKLSFSISNVINSPTTAPSDQFRITLMNKDGDKIAQNLSAGRVATILPYKLPISAFYAEPKALDLGIATDYNIIYKPETYIPGMLLEVKLPVQLSLQNINIIDCSILFDKAAEKDIVCEYDQFKDSVIFGKALDAPEPTDSKTEGIVFKFGKIMNPTQLLETDSFGVTTFTKDGYLIDQRLEDLIVSFTCLKPCRLCAPETNNQCIACFAEDDPFNPFTSVLSDGKCVTSCPYGLKKLQSEDTFPGFVHTTCVKCFDPYCDTCSGPDEGQCLDCIFGKDVKNGVCVDSIEEPKPDTYPFPFLVCSLIWVALALLLFCLCKKRKQRQVFFLPLAIPGVVFFSLIMALYDGAVVYPSKQAYTAATMVILFAIILPFLLQICFLLFVQLRLTKEQQYLDFRYNFKLSTFVLMAVSFVINLRCFKFIYSNISDRYNLELLRRKELRSGWRPQRLYMFLSMAMIPFDLTLVIVALVLLSSPKADTRLVKVAIERILIGLMLIFFTVFEYFMPHRNCCKRDKTAIAPQKVMGAAPQWNKSAQDQRLLTQSMATDLDQSAVNRSIVMQEPQTLVTEANDEPNKHLKQFEMNATKLDRSTSAERRQDKDPKLHRFLRKPGEKHLNSRIGTYYLVSSYDPGYLSDPTHLYDDEEVEKLRSVAPEALLGTRPQSLTLFNSNIFPTITSQEMATNKSIDLEAALAKATLEPSLEDLSEKRDVMPQTQFSSERNKQNLAHRSDSSFNEDMGITPSSYDIHNWSKRPVRENPVMESYSDDQNNDIEPERLQPSISQESSLEKSNKKPGKAFNSNFDLEQMVAHDSPQNQRKVPPVGRAPRHRRQASEASDHAREITNRHRKGCQSQANSRQAGMAGRNLLSKNKNVPLGGGDKLKRLPLDGLGTGMVSSSRNNNGSPTPQSMRLRSTGQSNMHTSPGKLMRRGGSVYKHEGMSVPSRPGIEAGTYGTGNRANSVNPIQSQRAFHTTEQAALAILSHRFGLRDISMGKSQGSYILYRASYKPRRWRLQGWLEDQKSDDSVRMRQITNNSVDEKDEQSYNNTVSRGSDRV